MAQVHFSRGKTYELAAHGDENPTEYLESEGERLIKQMVQKQLNKQVSLKEQLEVGKVFESSAELIPLTKLTSGQVSVSEFKELAEKASQLEDLKSLGLTEKEIELLKDSEGDQSHFEEKYRKIELSALKTNLGEIRRKVERKSKEAVNEKSAGSERSISRHELELSLSVKPQSDHTKLLQFALSCQPATTVDRLPLNHPINSLKALESELFGHLKPSSSGRKRKVPKKHSEGSNQTACDVVDCSRLSSLWDKRTKPQPKVMVKEERERSHAKVYDCAPKKMFILKDNQIVPLEGNAKEIQKGCPSHTCSFSEGHSFVFAEARGEALDHPPIPLVSLEEIVKNKMEEEEMAEYPHFKNYSRGEPSQVLYVKNISPTVTEDDLVSVFGNFETTGGNRIVYRLMTGRMKGQAFITFPNVKKASLALEAINGYYCKGKPLVVQFGKSKK